MNASPNSVYLISDQTHIDFDSFKENAQSMINSD